jgi:hypothetical protein
MFKYLAAVALIAAPSIASAQAVIDNGAVRLGVGQYGQLNNGGFGVYDLRNRVDGTRAGCECEGWGVAVSGTSTTGYANNSVGTAGLTLASFTSTANSATSTVQVNASALSVVHEFVASAVADLYKVNVTITNSGAAATTGNILYRRVMDWDIEPTAFNEYSTIQGTRGAANVLYASDNGFASGNPLATGDRTSIASGAVGDFIDSGPTDHGALFDFSFDPLAAGASRTFSIYYGASLSEANALAALGTVGAEVYSLGQSSDNRLGTTAGRSTFIFGFGGVGGTAVPGAVPEPATWAMMLFGFGGIGAAMRRRKSKTATNVALA